MGTEDFHCPKCSQLNTINHTICENCGEDLKQALDSIKHVEKVARNRTTRIRDIIVVTVFIGIIIAVTVPPLLFPGLKSTIAESTIARGIGSALSSTITNKHANCLITGTPYSASDVVAKTLYSGGITATTGEPEDGQISAVSPTSIRLHYKNKVYEWDYIPCNGDTAAYLRETGDNW